MFRTDPKYTELVPKSFQGSGIAMIVDKDAKEQTKYLLDSEIVSSELANEKKMLAVIT